MRLPWGSGVEVVEAAALFKAEQEATLAYERENLTTYLYRHTDRFTISEPVAPAAADCAEARVTVDTQEDYEAVKAIFEALYVGVPIESEQLVAWLRSRGGGRGSHG